MVQTFTEFKEAWKAQRRHQLMVAGVVLLLLTIGVSWLFVILHPLPPRTITMVTGPEGSAFAEFGKRYQAALALDGIQLKLLETDGAVDNLARLNDPQFDVQLGFADSGMTTETESPHLASLGAISFEPLWLFVRGVSIDSGINVLRGKRLSIGPPGSDTRKLSLALMQQNAFSVRAADVSGLNPLEAAKELKAGRLDAAVILTSWQSPVIQDLLRADQVSVVSFPRADAYVALYPFLTKLTLPAGVADLAQGRPPKDTWLLATHANLIVRKDLHPAIQYLLLETAADIHARSFIFGKAAQFPMASVDDLPLSKHARHYYQSGRPFLQRYLPFWLAVVAEQLLVLMIPLLGVLYPAGKGLAALYQWGIQQRIIRIYGELWFLENQLESGGGSETPQSVLPKMQSLQKRANRLRVSATFIPMLYSLKNHIELVCDKLERLTGEIG